MREGTRSSGPGHAHASARALVTILKADISGSTALGERLDPEELRGVLGSYFTALAREIHRHGGVVDKFIGDAIVAIFGIPDQRPDDAARAVTAAVAMQEAIGRENAGLRARYGVELTCRIGVATGDVVAGAIAEDVQASDTVVGDTMTLAEALESAAPLGSVLVSPTTRAAAGDAIECGPLEQATPKGTTATLLAHRVVGLRRATAVARDRASSARTSPSLQVGSERDHVLAEQRKNVTVLFADIVSDVPLATRLRPEDLRTVFASYFGVLARAIQRYGGTIDKYIGDAVMAVFGAPVSHEDDGVRAVRAALAIQRNAGAFAARVKRDHGIDVAIRVGVNTGEVVAGMLQGELLAYTVTGDTVNTAQRIEAATAAGAVFVSETTRALARNAFFFDEPLAITVKGKSEPLPVYRVLGVERRASPRGGPKIVGRDGELAWLYERYREAIAGRGQVVHVHGEAGVGKTRLVGELLSGLPKGTARLRGRASSYEQATPYALVGDLVRRMFGIGLTDDEGQARAALARARELDEFGEAAGTLILELLGYDARSPLDPVGKRRLLLAVLRSVFAGRASSGSLVVVIEDLHWRDASSADLLRDLVTGVGALPCLLVTTSREAADVTWPAERLSLEALPREAALELIARLARVPIDDATTSVILERTGGNPFFIEEVVRSQRPGKELVVPATVQDLLEARLDALDAPPRRAAHAGAIVGRMFSTRIVARVVPDVDVDPAVVQLEEDRFVDRILADEPTYAFVHALVQEVAYRTQLIAQRRRAHVVVGDAYVDLFPERSEEFIDTLAFHYRRGDDDPKAVRWLIRAGHRAQRLYANAEALDYFGAAFERAPGDPVARADAQEAMGDVLRVVGRYDDALARYADAMSIPLDDPILTPRLRRKSAIVHQLRGELLRAAEMYREVLAALPADAHEERARTLLNIAEATWRQGRYDDAVRHLEAVVEATADPAIAAEALKQLGTVWSHKGDLDSARAYFERSLAAYERVGEVLGEANVYNNIGLLERSRSRHDAALSAYEKALAIRDRIGDQLGRVHSHNNIAEINYLRGQLQAAAARYLAGLEIARSIGYTMGIGSTLIGLGATRVEEGQIEAGISHLRDGLVEVERTGNRSYLGDALCDLSNAYSAQRSPEAVATAERAVAIAREMHLPDRTGIALQALGRAHIALGHLSDARVALEESRTLLEPLDEPQHLARTLTLLGALYRSDPARADEGRALLDRARDTFRRLDAALDLRRLEELADRA